MEAKLLINDQRVAGGPLLKVRNTYTEKVIGAVTVPIDTAPACKGYFGLWARRPIGVVASIDPGNFLLDFVAHKVAPALACGLECEGVRYAMEDMTNIQLVAIRTS